MTEGWFTDDELDSVRELALPGMTSPVTIKRRSVNPDNDPSQIYGTTSESFTVTETVGGWLFSTPSPVITIVGGEMALVNTYRLFLPVGTAVTSGDRVVIGGSEFIVSDTTEESTWLALLRCSLRRVE
jgi:hypothetical protein